MKFSQFHVWIKDYDDEIMVGLSKYIRDNLGTILYIDLPNIGDVFEIESILSVVESSKAAIEIPSPVYGEITAVNEFLKHSPRLLNEDPEGSGFLVKMKLLSEPDLTSFLNSEDYYLMNA
ncbi:MAG: glycine cleavage system protein H [Victivallaceae bacterium]